MVNSSNRNFILDLNKFTSLLANPEKTDFSAVIELDAILNKYPFFQSARALHLKGLKNQGSYRYNEALKITAAHTSDRDILFQYITSEEFAQNQISQDILKSEESIRSLEVISVNVSEEVIQEEEKQFELEKQKAAAILNPDLFQKRNSDSSTVASVEKETSEQDLISKPLEFSTQDRFSFSEWLKLSRAQPIERSEESENTIETKEKDVRDRQSELIERFIQERPRIIPDPVSPETKNQKENPVKKLFQEEAPQESLMTETLAKVYLQQRNYKKAIQAYKILILKYPEKSGFFADQIRAIEKLINPEHQ